jgi:hypothetical protein
MEQGYLRGYRMAMRFPDFACYFQDLKSAGFTILHARYTDCFGSWSIEFSSERHLQHRLIWDGRDRWLTLQSERPESERTHLISPEKLRKMNYMDGVTAKSWSDEDAWQVKWIGREEAEQTFEQVLKELSS